MRTYTVRWERPGESVPLECRNLSARVLAQIMGAAKRNGGVIIHEIKPEKRESGHVRAPAKRGE